MRKVIDLECDLPPDETGKPRKSEGLEHPPGYGAPEKLPPLPGHGFGNYANIFTTRKKTEGGAKPKGESLDSVVARISTGDASPYTFASSPGAVWVTTDAGTTLRIDTKTNRVAQTVSLSDGSAPGDPDTVGGRVWVPDGPSGTVSVVDAATSQVVGTVRVGTGFWVAQRGFGDLWVIDYMSSGMVRIDPSLGPR